MRSNRAAKHVGLLPIVLMLMIAGRVAPIPVSYSKSATGPISSFDGWYPTGILLTNWSEDAPSSWCQVPGQPIITVASSECNINGNQR